MLGRRAQTATDQNCTLSSKGIQDVVEGRGDAVIGTAKAERLKCTGVSEV